jgi:leucyl aminopeptidase (aminopeptidase T)
MLEPHGREAYNIAELGIGTNDKAIISGKILEDEKILGTVHLALGDNKSMGGAVGVSSHLDGLILKPSVWIDGERIMEDGKLLI